MSARQQLLGQWRELNSIYKLQNKHILINFIYDYPLEHLCVYSKLVINEMRDRNYKINLNNFKDFFNNNNINPCFARIDKDLYYNKMNDRYLKQCLYNLQEKFDCNSISNQEWEIIYKNFNKNF